MNIHKYFILRAPIYSLAQLKNLKDIDTIIHDPYFIKAIYIASPTLYHAILKYKSHADIPKSEYNRLKNSIIRYYTRMCSRCTPFGLFSGYAIGCFGNGNQIVLNGDKEVYTYFEITFLNKIINRLIDNHQLKDKLLYYSNSYLLETEDKIRYIEIDDMDLCKGYSYSEIENNEIIADIIEKGKKGIKINDLIHYLSKYDFDKSEIENYVNEIISSQILIPEWQLSISDNHLLEKISTFLRPIEDPLLDILNFVVSKPTKEKDIHLQEMEKVANTIRTLKDFNFDTYSKSPYNISCKLIPGCISLSPQIKESILDGVRFLSIVTPPYVNNRLKLFKENFYKRYEERAVPLLEAVDPVMGLGYPNTTILRKKDRIIDKLSFENKKEYDDTFINKKISQLLLKKVNEGKNEIQLSKEDIQDMGGNNTFAACMTVLTEIVYDPLRGKELIYLKSVSGHTGTYALSRFCWSDPEMYTLTEELSKKDTINNAANEIEAEIVHVPENTEGNVLLRPVLKDRIILCNANDHDTTKDILYLSDLVLQMKNNELKLIRKDTGETILPYNSTAHNYSISRHPAYMLLSDLQFNRYANSMYLDIRFLLDFYEHIPRISYHNCILSLETWQIKAKDLQNLVRNKEGDELIKEITAWRKTRNIPPRVICVENDNTLLIDFNVLESIQTFLSMNQKNNSIEIKEFIYDTCQSLTTDDKKNPFANEFIFTITDNND